MLRVGWKNLVCTHFQLIPDSCNNLSPYRTLQHLSVVPKRWAHVAAKTRARKGARAVRHHSIKKVSSQQAIEHLGFFMYFA